MLLAHSAGYVELFYGRPRTQSSWELATDALARSRSGVLVGGAKRLYGIVEGGDLAYVEERVDADGGLVPHLSARLSRYAGYVAATERGVQTWSGPRARLLVGQTGSSGAGWLRGIR